MSCNKCANQCKDAAGMAGVPQLDAEWSAGSRQTENCPKCGGFLTEAGQCNSPRHNWVSQLDQEARLYGTTARNVLEEDPRFDDPNFMPQGAPSAYMAQMGSGHLQGDDAPTPADTLESLVDEYEETMGDKAVNNPAYLDAIRVLNDETATERDIHPVMKAMAEAYRKDADPEIAAESDALLQTDEILAARERKKIKRTAVSVAPPVNETPEAKLRGQLQKLLAATEPYEGQFVIKGKRDTAKLALQSGASPRVIWNAMHSLNLGYHETDATNGETANTTDVLAQTGLDLWGKPLPDDAYQSKEEARAASMWMTELTYPPYPLNTDEATAAVSQIINFGKNKMWRSDYITPNDASALMRAANWSEIGPENTGRFFETFNDLAVRNGDTVSQEKVLGAMLQNPTTPPELLNGRFPMFANRFKPEQVAALVAHPNFGKSGQEALMRSPKPTVRKVLAESGSTHPDVLKAMIKDPSRNVALAALRNKNQPLAGAVEAGRKSGIADTQLLSQMQNKTRTWRDTPRCSVCGAWTKPDGVCGNRRCGAKGQKTAEAKRWPPVGTPNLGVAIADDIYTKLNRDYGKREQFKAIRNAWADAMQGEITPPKEWRGAIAEGVTQLAAIGEYEVADGRKLAWNEEYGAYTLNGIPVQADNAGQAIRTTLKMMAMQGDRAVDSLASQLEYGKQQLVVGDKILQYEKNTGIYSVYDLASSASGGEPIHQRSAPEDPKHPDYAAARTANEEAVKKFFAAENLPYYRYSPGMRQMVLQTETEPTPMKPTASIASTGLT